MSENQKSCPKLSLYFAEHEFYAAYAAAQADGRAAAVISSRIEYSDANHQVLAARLSSHNLFLTSETQFIVPPSGFSERLRFVEPSDDLSSYTNEERLAYFLAVLQSRGADVRGEPLFNADGEDVAFVPLTSGNKHFLASVAKDDIFQTGRDLLQTGVCGDLPDELDLNLDIESAARAGLRESIIQDEKLLSLPSLIFFLITLEGFALAVYHPDYGIIDEYAEQFLKPAQKSAQTSGADYAADLADSYDDFIGHAFAQILSRYGEGNQTSVLKETGIAQVASVIVAASPDLREMLDQHVETAVAEGFDVQFTDERPEILIVRGLLSGAESEQQAVEFVNYLDDLTGFAARRDEEAQNEARLEVRRKRAQTALLAFAPLVVAVGILAGMFFNNLRDKALLSFQMQSEKQRAEQLKPQKTELESYVKNYAWYKESFKEVLDLRARQKSAISLLSNLNSRFPLILDPSFSINEMKLAAGGALEIKGTAQSEDAATAFVRSLEYAPSDIKPNAKMFDALSFDVRRGNLQNSPQIGISVNPEQLGTSIAFTIKGTYAAFAPSPAAPSASPAQMPNGTK